MTVTVPTIEQKDKPAGTYNTVCMTCSHTCHMDCAFADDNDKEKCCVMTDG